MEQISPTWMWAIAGILLLMLEIATASFFIMFFGLSALIVAFLVHFGLSDIAWQILIFASLGGMGIFVFRSK